MAENYKNESMVDVAFSILNQEQRTMRFQELFHEIALKLELSDLEKEELISHFYTNLTLDGRFVNLGDNEWDLRTNQTYDKVHIDMNDVYSDMDEETKGNTDLEEYDKDEIEAEGLDTDSEDSEEDDSQDYDRSSKEDM